MGGIVLGGVKGVHEACPSRIVFRLRQLADQKPFPVWLYSQLVGTLSYRIWDNSPRQYQILAAFLTGISGHQFGLQLARITLSFV